MERSIKKGMTLIELLVVSKRGMTLVELLVSLAIIAILAATALPTFVYFQRQNSLKQHARSLEQLFFYSRTLNNNPSFETRTFGETNNQKRYGIKISLANKTATLYPVDNSGNLNTEAEIDSLPFDRRESISFSGCIPNAVDSLPGNCTFGPIDHDMTFFISGDPPTEVLSCVESIPNGAAPVFQPDCSDKFIITLSVSGVSTVKKITIQNTSASSGQQFGVKVE